MKKAFSIMSLEYWKAYSVTTRPYLMFLSGVSGLVGLALGYNFVDAPETTLVIFWAVFAAFFFSYGLGQALTDVFQTDTDSLSSPYRPLTQGLITKRQVFLTSLLGLMVCGLVVYIANPITLGFTLLSIFGLIYYTPFKRVWWGGPFWNSWIVALLPLIGFLASNKNNLILFSSNNLSILVAVMLSVFFSYSIFVLLGYFKDISADSETNYNTIPVVFGWQAGVLISVAHLFLCIICSSVVLIYFNWKFFPGIFWISGILVLVWAHWQMWTTKEESLAYKSIQSVVRGYMLLHIGEALLIKPDLICFGFCFYFIFELILHIRPERTQV